MKLRKCLLWQTQRPSVSGLRHGLEMSIRFRDGLSTGKRNIGWIHPFDSFPPWEKKRKEKRENGSKDFTVSIGKFAEPWMLHSKLGDNIYRYTGILGIYEHSHSDLPWKVEARFLSRVQVTRIYMYKYKSIVFSSSPLYKFFQISSLDCRKFIELSCSSFHFLFQIFLAIIYYYICWKQIK